ncbi:MAG: c-type cytochrome [Pseudomonadota bacterium]|nr:c-type cytochrome [Pseudomonadota bacterium]
MKKLVMLASIGLCGLSTIAVVQAQPEAATTPVAASTVVETTPAATPAPVEAQPEAAAKPKPVVPQDPPNVQRMIALYPQLIQRIAPYGKVCVEGKPCDVTVPVVAAAAPSNGEPRSGEEVYNSACTTCHASGLLGAPTTGDKGAWSARIAQGKDTLYKHAINGFNAMPARGGAELSDQEVKNGVDYLVSKAQ